MQSFRGLLLAGLGVIAFAAPVSGQRPGDQISPKSIALMHQGQAVVGG